MQVQLVKLGKLYVRDFPVNDEFGPVNWEVTETIGEAKIWHSSVLSGSLLNPHSAQNVARACGGKVISLKEADHE